MAITINSTFRYIVLSWNPDDSRWNRINARTDGLTPEYASVYLSSFTGASITTALLITLREIYASAAGFVNEDGDSIDVRVENLYNITTAEELEPNGYANPLIAGYEERATTLRQVQGTFLREASVRKDSNTGRSTCASQRVLFQSHVSLMATWLS